jgi:hypothetical protein
MAHLARLPRSAPKDTRVSGEIVGAAADRLAGLLDPVHGGLRGAPKFPQAPVTDLLWRAARRGSVSPETLDRLLLTLETMSQGGIYDHIGGGLSRYSVDDRWLVPHFEKMLYDNAQYIRALRLAIPLAPEREARLFRERLEETVDFLHRDMELDGGGFAASLDADSEGEEGRYYVWTPDEVVSVIGPDAAIRFNQVYDITTGGNFEGRNIPNRLSSVDRIEDAVDEDTLRTWRSALLQARSRRIAPGRDDKMLADWNGYLIAALAECALLVSRESWRQTAVRAWSAIETRMDGPDGLAHAWRAGRATRPAFASDHASLMRAALALGETAPTAEEADRWLDAARDHAERLERDFAHPDGGYHLTSSQARDVIMRPYMALDEAVPNPNGLAAEALLRLWLLTGDQSYRLRVERILCAFAGEIAANVFGTASLLSAIDARDNAVLAIIVTADGTRCAELDQALYAQGDPAIVTWTIGATMELPISDPRAGKQMTDNRPTLYLCREGLCSAPLVDPADIPVALASLRGAS